MRTNLPAIRYEVRHYGGQIIHWLTITNLNTGHVYRFWDERALHFDRLEKQDANG